MSRRISALSPGLLLGPYPENADKELSGFAAAVQSVLGTIQQRIRPRRSALERTVAVINGLEANYRNLDDAEVRAAGQALNAGFRRDGLSDKHLQHAFALIREVADRTLGMRHFDVQLMGGWAMITGAVAEMQTGEGKTLTATLPACAAGLAGIPVHVITVNDYLVTRDADEMRPVYEFLGLTVGTITQDMDIEERRAAYSCDITYCTNKQVAFDYLKDRLALGQRRGVLGLSLESLYSDEPRAERLLMPGLCFAIVDEVDSVMIDEAQTPLILSAPQQDAEVNAEVYAEALQLSRDFLQDIDYTLNERHRHIELTSRGLERLEAIGETHKGVWSNTRFSEEMVVKALSARFTYVLDEHYLIKDDKVMIIDEFTGRVMPDRSWEQGLHQLIEMKEGVELTPPNETIAKISYQRFFRRYLMLSGMTGTAYGVAGELWADYKLKVVRIPTNKPNIKVLLNDRYFVTQKEKWSAIVARIAALQARGQPVLVGTRSVAASEHLGKLLDDKQLKYTILNARQDDEEASIVAEAGLPGAITVATNMAGRGTDIKLQGNAADQGGLYVIAAERNESSRIDRQLFGRSGRQGDPGCGEAILSLEDELFTRYGSEQLLGLAGKAGAKTAGGINYYVGRIAVLVSQWAAERQGRALRKGLTRMDDRLKKTLSFAGAAE